MKFAVVDFETYYDNEYSLTKMSTEEYVTDPRFEVILVSVKIDDQPTVWFSGTMAQTQHWLEGFSLHECGVSAHNNMFDGLILVEVFKIIPAMFFCTRQMAQAILRPYMPRVSLEKCLAQLNLGEKGQTVHAMRGRVRQSLMREELFDYAAYCSNDTEGCYALFKFLAPRFPRREFEIMDLTLRMYFFPRFELDATQCAQHLQDVRAKKAQLLASLPEEVQKADLMSNPRFAALLESHGVEIPYKLSPTTGNLTYAFGKSDSGFKDMQEEYLDNPVVSAIITARLGVKSTLEESRSERLRDIAIRFKKFRVPINYYAAHTGRDGGTEKINAQNFPRIDKSRMRYAILAPKGHVVLAADLAQVEARITAWLATCLAQLLGWSKGIDLYADFITRASGKDTVKGRSKEDDKRRFIGKTCILGLGFGMGALKLKATLYAQGIIITIEEAQKYVNTYRQLYHEIQWLWSCFDNLIGGVMSSGRVQHKVGPVTVMKNSILLPNDMPLVYNRLRHVQNEKYTGWSYNFGAETRTLWGGKITENVVQALARIIIMDNMLAIRKQLGIIPALRQHDELDYIVREDEAAGLAEAIRGIMVVPPEWASDLPLAVEINWGPSLGDCK